MINPVQVSTFTPVETGCQVSSWPALYLSPLFNKEIAVLQPGIIDTEGNQGCAVKSQDTTCLMTAVKIATYILSAGILPLLAIIMNVIIRCGTNYYYINNSQPQQPAPVNPQVPTQPIDQLPSSTVEAENPSVVTTNNPATATPTVQLPAPQAPLPSANVPANPAAQPRRRQTLAERMQQQEEGRSAFLTNPANRAAFTRGPGQGMPAIMQAPIVQPQNPPAAVQAPQEGLDFEELVGTFLSLGLSSAQLQERKATGTDEEKRAIDIVIEINASQPPAAAPQPIVSLQPAAQAATSNPVLETRLIARPNMDAQTISPQTDQVFLNPALFTRVSGLTPTVQNPSAANALPPFIIDTLRKQLQKEQPFIQAEVISENSDGSEKVEPLSKERLDDEAVPVDSEWTTRWLKFMEQQAMEKEEKRRELAQARALFGLL